MEIDGLGWRRTRMTAAPDPGRVGKGGGTQMLRLPPLAGQVLVDPGSGGPGVSREQVPPP